MELQVGSGPFKPSGACHVVFSNGESTETSHSWATRDGRGSFFRCQTDQPSMKHLRGVPLREMASVSEGLLGSVFISKIRVDASAEGGAF